MPSTTSSKKPKSAPKPQHEWSFTAIGTTWWIGLYQPVSAAALQELQTDITRYINRFDQLFSRFRDDSLVTRIAQVAGHYNIGDDGAALLNLYRRLYDATDGAVTPLIGQTMVDAGYDATYTLIPGTPRPAPAWDKVVRLEGTILTTHKPVVLDVGAAGKGYLVDRISSLLADAGITASCVDGSGDMYIRGIEAPLRVGLEHPADTTQIIGVAELSDVALCGSASNRRQWGKYHHIINPRTAQPARDIIATWVTAATAAEADGLATALFFVDAAQLATQFTFEYCVVRHDFKSIHSPGFPATLFT